MMDDAVFYTKILAVCSAKTALAVARFSTLKQSPGMMLFSWLIIQDAAPTVRISCSYLQMLTDV